MSYLSDKYSKNFSKARKADFNRRFREDYDPNMSELSNILLILVCAIAPKAPTIIDPPDRKAKTSCQLWAMPPNTSNRTLANIAPIANLGTIAMKAVTGVGAPS